MSGVLAIAGADLGERVRRFTFLFMLAAALYAGYLWVPAPGAGYAAVVVNGHRGLYTSAFLGYATTMLVVVFMSLLGFFFVRGSIERDREFDVDGIVCASPVTRLQFVLGKFLSNFGVLLAISALVMLAAMLMQFLRAEDLRIDPMSYAVPFICIAVPTMAVVAALAVAFDLIPFMGGVLGGIAYVIGVWGMLLSLPTQRMVSGNPVDLMCWEWCASCRVCRLPHTPSFRTTAAAMGDSSKPELRSSHNPSSITAFRGRCSFSANVSFGFWQHWLLSLPPRCCLTAFAVRMAGAKSSVSASTSRASFQILRCCVYFAQKLHYSSTARVCGGFWALLR